MRFTIERVARIVLETSRIVPGGLEAVGRGIPRPREWGRRAGAASVSARKTCNEFEVPAMLLVSPLAAWEVASCVDADQRN